MEQVMQSLCHSSVSLLSVTLRVLALPIPEVACHVLEAVCGLESELLFCKAGVGSKVRDISQTPSDDLIGEAVTVAIRWRL